MHDLLAEVQTRFPLCLKGKAPCLLSGDINTTSYNFFVIYMLCYVTVPSSVRWLHVEKIMWTCLPSKHIPAAQLRVGTGAVTNLSSLCFDLFPLPSFFPLCALKVHHPQLKQNWESTPVSLSPRQPQQIRGCKDAPDLDPLPFLQVKPGHCLFCRVYSKSQDSAL